MAAIGSLFGFGKKEAPRPAPSPAAPSVSSAEDKAKAENLRRRKIQARTGGKTILSSQYGGATETATKTLLGQ